MISEAEALQQLLAWRRTRNLWNLLPMIRTRIMNPRHDVVGQPWVEGTLRLHANDAGELLWFIVYRGDPSYEKWLADLAPRGGEVFTSGTWRPIVTA